MNDKDAQFARRRIFALALNIARLRLHGAYIDEAGQLNLLSKDEVESYIRHFTQQLEYEAKNVLMLGGWEEEQTGA